MSRSLFLAMIFGLLGLSHSLYFGLEANASPIGLTPVAQPGVSEISLEEKIMTLGVLEGPRYVHLVSAVVLTREEFIAGRTANSLPGSRSALAPGVWLNETGKSIYVSSGNEVSLVPSGGLLSVGEFVNPSPETDSFSISLACQADQLACCKRLSVSKVHAYCYDAAVGFKEDCHTQLDDSRKCTVPGDLGTFEFSDTARWIVIEEHILLSPEG